MNKTFLATVILAILLGGCVLQVDTPQIQNPAQNQPEQIQPTPVSPAAIPQLTTYNQEIPILMYHHIGTVPADRKTDAVRIDLTVSAENFDAQMKWLQDKGYTSISMAEAATFVEHKGQFPAWSSFALPGKPVVISFDDGYEDAYTEALPVLKKYNFSGAFGIITGKVGTPEYMTWEQIQALRHDGMEILSHTVSHPDLRFTTDKELKKELENSKATLQDKLGIQVEEIVYPSGKFDARVIKAAEAAGYLGARTTANWKTTKDSSPYALPAVRIHGDTTLKHFGALLP